MGATEVRTEKLMKRQCCRYLRILVLRFDEYCDQIRAAGLYCENYRIARWMTIIQKILKTVLTPAQSELAGRSRPWLKLRQPSKTQRQSMFSTH